MHFKNIKSPTSLYHPIPIVRIKRNDQSKLLKIILKSGLASVDPDFSAAQWDRLIPQAEMTLNMLRRSRINCKILEYTYQFGNFDWNKNPLAPLGTRVVAHDPPTNCGI